MVKHGTSNSLRIIGFNKANYLNAYFKESLRDIIITHILLYNKWNDLLLDHSKNSIRIRVINHLFMK